MSTQAPPGIDPGPHAPLREPRRATRDTADALVGGVGAGLARHLGVPAMWVRLGFVVLTTVGGLGAIVYAGLWMVLPTDSRFVARAPGLEGAERTGKRPGAGARFRDLGPVVALGVLGVGLVLTAEAVLGRGALLWPVVLAVGGIALLWRQADEAQRERWLDSTGRIDPVRAVFGRGGWASYARVVAGALLVVGALALFSLRSGSMAVARDVVVAALLGVAGLAIIVGPWIFRLAGDLTSERAERIRTQERADMAAHLHDSVLQTLALIQRNADDGPLVSRLARSQERDLRAWLYSSGATDDSMLASALRGAAAEVEDTLGVSVDVVVVGDRAMSDRVRPLVLAAREAMVNAARHAGVDRVDVYAEATPSAIEVFVRDRGDGFDTEAVAEDRHGVRHSIIDRMRRHGGEARVRSTPGDGTEVRLWMPTDDEEERP